MEFIIGNPGCVVAKPVKGHVNSRNQFSHFLINELPVINLLLLTFTNNIQSYSVR